MQSLGDVDKNVWLRAEKVRMIYGLIPNDISGTFVVCILVSTLLWDVIPKTTIFLWFFLVMACEFFLYLMGVRYKKNSQSPDMASVWENRFAFLLFIQGVFDGFLGIFLFPENSVPHQSFIAAIIGGIIAGAIGFYAVSMKVVIAFTMPIILPFTIRVLAIGDRIHMIMGITIISYSVIMFFIAKRMNLITLNSLSLNYELAKAKENLEEEVKKATASLRKALEEEKRLKTEKEVMLRDLHDGIGGIITNINLIAEMAKQSKTSEHINKTIAKISDISREGISEIRCFMQSLEEKEISWKSLESELRDIGNSITEPHDIAFSMKVSIDGTSPPPGSFFYLNLLRIYKEALINIVKHSQSRSVMLILDVDRERLRCCISDDGIGIKDNKTNGKGIPNMKKRAEEIGGKITITSNGGTSVHLEIPIPIKYPEELYRGNN